MVPEKGRLHICIIGTAIIPPRWLVQGSSAVLSWSLAHKLAQAGEEVSLVGLESYYDLSEVSQEGPHTEGIKVYRVPYFPYDYKAYRKVISLRTIISLLRLLKRIRPDIIHVHGDLNMGYLAGICRRVLGIPTVATITRVHVQRDVERSQVGDMKKRPGLMALIGKRLLVGVDCFIALNSYMRGELVHLGIDPEKIEVVPYGIRREFEGSPEEKIDIFGNGCKTVLFWGDGNIKRGFDLFLSSNAILEREGSRLNFLITVRGFEDELEARALRLAQENSRIKVFVNQREPYPWPIEKVVASVEIVALPYLINPMEPPLTLIESMALGRGVITTGVGGNRELIENYRNGVLIGHDPRQLADAIKQLAYDDAKRREIGKGAQETVRRVFSWGPCIDAVSRIYEKVSGKAGTTTRSPSIPSCPR